MKASKVIYDGLNEAADYAIRSRSKALMYETYGAAKMAREMFMISKEQFYELNTKLVKNGINNPRAYDDYPDARKHKTPCDLCGYNPPSCMDGKPCSVCPAIPLSDPTDERDNNPKGAEA